MAFLPLLKKGKGRIVNMSSVSGRIATPFNIPYCISKCGIEAMSDALRYVCFENVPYRTFE